MKVIIGLGNPEKDYKGTRHNVGFEVINKLAYDYSIEISRAKFRAHFGEGRLAGQKVLLVKPQTYMNLSGESIRELLLFYKLNLADIIVVYDDISLPIGAIRIREEGSAGGHNGIRNIIYQMDSARFNRIRIGIGEKPPGWDLADYVLSRFKPHETEGILDGITKAGKAIEHILKEGMASAMNQFNERNK